MPFTAQELKAIRLAYEEIERERDKQWFDRKEQDEIDRWLDNMAREDMLDHRERLTKKKIAAYRRAYREANKDKIVAYQRAYYEANKDKIAARHRAYREANKDKIAAYRRAYYEANKDKIAAYQRAYREVNKTPKAGSR